MLPRDVVELLENEPIMKPEKMGNDEIEINANFIFPSSPGQFIPPYYKEHPSFHKIKDRVIILNDKGFFLIPQKLY